MTANHRQRPGSPPLMLPAELRSTSDNDFAFGTICTGLRVPPIEFLLVQLQLGPNRVFRATRGFTQNRKQFAHIGQLTWRVCVCSGRLDYQTVTARMITRMCTRVLIETLAVASTVKSPPS